MLTKLMTGAAFAAAATPAEAQPLQNVVETLLRRRISSSPHRRDRDWRKDQGALSEAARQVNPTAPIEAVLREIRAQHPTVDTLIPTASDDLAGLAGARGPPRSL